jgi:hypothetical protein
VIGRAPARAGLIAVDADDATSVQAFLVAGDGQREGLADVPVFTASEVYQAGVEAPVADLPAGRALGSLLVGAANVSERAAACRADLYDEAGERVAAIPFEVPALSLAREDALAWTRAERISAVQVSCDQSFYPVAVATASDDAKARPIFGAASGPSGACDYKLTLARQQDGTYTAATPAGIIHQASKPKPKGVVCVMVPAGEIRAGKIVYEWDVTVGPWSKRQRSGLHALMYTYLERYRSGTIGNVIAAGPSKSFIKFMQNVGMPRKQNTNVKGGFALDQGVVYHFVYTYDAARKTATLQMFDSGGHELKRISQGTRPGGQQILLRPYGKGGLQGLATVVEFGNRNGQHLPEVETWGWVYANWRMTVTPK